MDIKIRKTRLIYMRDGKTLFLWLTILSMRKITFRESIQLLCNH